jgi:hypothetical protein
MVKQSCPTLRRLLPIQTMSSLVTSAQFSFLYRQEWLITFGLNNVFYGVCHDLLIHTRLMYRQSGIYTTLVAFLVYFFCESLDHTQLQYPNFHFHQG